MPGRLFSLFCRHAMKLRHLIVPVMLPLFASCGHSDEPEPPQPEVTPRTVLVYMVADNNLSSNGTTDIAEMQQAALKGDLGKSRLLVYLDGVTGMPELFEITPDGKRTTLVTYDDATLSVTRERLEQVIGDAKEAAPAANYGLVMWGHGTGYVQDGVDDGLSALSFGGQSHNRVSYWMNTTTMARALKDKGFDWIYFDCCFMAGVEVVYELRNVTDHIIGSVTELPAEGMPYHKTLKHLMPARSDLDGAARETFGHFDAQQGMYRTCTMSVIRTDAMDELARVMRSVYTGSDGLPDNYVPQQYQTASDHNRYGWSYYDLEHYALALAGSNEQYRNLVATAMDYTVTSAYATPFLWSSVGLSNHSGLSTLIIESADDPQLDKFGYRELSWWTDVVAPRFNR